MENRFLVVGLGSMGKRRVRNLLALNAGIIAGFDPRSDRRDEAHEKYSIQVFDSFEKAIKDFSPTALVISTPPDLHMEYAFRALELGIGAFIEASVVDAEKIKILHQKSNEKGIVFCPSCTMRFFPGPKIVKELIQKGEIGKTLFVNYHTGQYLPDWHPWEDIKDFYVSKRETGAAREIVPFELTWLNDIWGIPQVLTGVKKKLTSLQADIDDIYTCILEYPNGVLANVTVEVISRPVHTRELRVLGEKGEIIFSADRNSVRYINIDMKDWKEFNLASGTVEKQYINPEEPYIDEMRCFVSAVSSGDQKKFPNSLQEDYGVLEVLYSLESKSK